MSYVKNITLFFQTLGLSSNSKTKESSNNLSGGYLPQDVVKKLILTPAKSLG
jgi:hypothetical protein